MLGAIDRLVGAHLAIRCLSVSKKIVADCYRRLGGFDRDRAVGAGSTTSETA
jgi:hypothetical protein